MLRYLTQPNSDHRFSDLFNSGHLASPQEKRKTIKLELSIRNSLHRLSLLMATMNDELSLVPVSRVSPFAQCDADFSETHASISTSSGNPTKPTGRPVGHPQGSRKYTQTRNRHCRNCAAPGTRFLRLHILLRLRTGVSWSTTTTAIPTILQAGRSDARATHRGAHQGDAGQREHRGTWAVADLCVRRDRSAKGSRRAPRGLAGCLEAAIWVPFLVHAG